jgi:hypothetical protein
MAMNRIVWARLDNMALIVAVSMMLVVNFTVKAHEKGRLQVASQSSDWKCHPNHARGPACFNMADDGRTIVAASLN